MTQKKLTSSFAQPSSMTTLKQHCFEANQLTSQMVKLPIILAEINQNGGILSSQFPSLFQELFAFDELFLTFPFDEDEDSFRYWIFEFEKTPEEKLHTISSKESYEAFCTQYSYYNDLQNEDSHPYIHSESHFWDADTQGLLL